VTAIAIVPITAVIPGERWTGAAPPREGRCAVRACPLPAVLSGLCREHASEDAAASARRGYRWRGRPETDPGALAGALAREWITRHCEFRDSFPFALRGVFYRPWAGYAYRWLGEDLDGGPLFAALRKAGARPAAMAMAGGHQARGYTGARLVTG
jgi:hypothetical protein